MATNIWRNAAALMSSPRLGPGGAGSPGAALVFGGFSGSGYLNSSEQFNGVNWTAKAVMSAARVSMGSVGSAVSALAFGGADGSSYLRTAEMFDNGTWVSAASMSSIRLTPAGVGVASYALAAGGFSGGAHLGVTEVLSGGVWAAGKPMSAARSAAGGVGSAGYALVFGGYDGANGLASAERFTGDAWTSVAGMPAARHQMAGTGSTTDAFAFGGTDGTKDLASSVNFDGVGWTSLANMSTPRNELGGVGSALSALAFGGVFAITDDTTYLNSAEIYAGAPVVTTSSDSFSGGDVGFDPSMTSSSWSRSSSSDSSSTYYVNRNAAWAKLKAPTADWRALACSRDGSVVLAAPDRGPLCLSEDRGTIWRELDAGIRGWRSVAMTPRAEMLAAVDSVGLIHTSKDLGLNWFHDTGAGERDWRGVALGNEGNFMLAAAAGGRIWTKFCFDGAMSTSSASSKSSASSPSSDANDAMVAITDPAFPGGLRTLAVRDITFMVGGAYTTHYKYKLDGAASYSAERAVSTPLSFTNVADGPHSVTVVGRDMSGYWRLDREVSSTWSVDSAEPNATLTGVPSGCVNVRTADISVAGSHLMGYIYKLDAGNYSAEALLGVPITLAGLVDGEHSLSVLGVNAARVWQSSPTFYSWSVDTIAPTAQLSGVPTGRTQATTAEIQVSGDGVESYLWSLDGGAYSSDIAAATPISLAGLADGPHYVRVKGRDLAGNLQAIPTTSSTWTVDTIAPTALLSGVPTGATQATTANIYVSGDGVVSYQYSLDGGAYSSDIAAATPISLAGLADGTHYVSVKGRDSAGNLQAIPTTSSTWTVDTIAPTAQLSGVPTGATQATTAEIQVSGDGVESYLWSLDGGAYSSDIAAATRISLAGLADGTHYVRVKGRDLAGNLQAIPTTSSTWTVDNVAPTAQLSGVPTGATQATTAEIQVSGAGVVSYQYSLDGGAYSSDIAAATRISLAGLADGPHYVSVKGRDSAGNLQAIPTTSSTWTVDTIAPTAQLGINDVWAASGNMGTKRMDLAGCGTATDALAVGGRNSGGSLNTTERSTNGVWAAAGYMGTPRAYLAGCGTATDALAMGGGNSGGYLNTTERATNGVWAAAGNMVTERIYLAGCGTATDALAMGGGNSNSGGSLNTTERSTNGVWAAAGNMVTARAYLAGCGTATDALAMGGFNSGVLQTTERSTNGVWAAAGNMVTARFHLAGCGTATDALAVGGSGNYAGYLNTTERATNGVWAAAGNMVIERDSLAGCGTATDALAVGGRNSGDYLNTTERLELSITVSGAGVATYQYAFDSETEYSADIAAATPISLAGLADGTHYVSVKGRDSAGNLQYPATQLTFTS